MNLREKNVKYARNLLPWLDFQKPNFKVLSLKSFLSHLFINIVVLFSKESYFLRVFSFLRVSVDRILTVFTASNFSNFKSTPKIIALTHFTISVTNRIFWSLVLFFFKVCKQYNNFDHPTIFMFLVPRTVQSTYSKQSVNVCCMKSLIMGNLKIKGGENPLSTLTQVLSLLDYALPVFSSEPDF